MDRQLVGDIEEAGDGVGHKIFVVAVGDSVDTAVEDVDAVVGVAGSAGENEGVAPIEAAVDGGGGGGHLEGAARDEPRGEVDDGHVGRLGITDDDAAGAGGSDHVAVVGVVILVGVVVLVGVIVLDDFAGGGGLSGGGRFGVGVVATGNDDEGSGQDGREGNRESHETESSGSTSDLPGPLRVAGS